MYNLIDCGKFHGNMHVLVSVQQNNNKIVGEKSVLDYVILTVSDELIKNIKNMKIDTAKQLTSWHALKSGKRFSDHNSIIRR